MQGSNLNLLLNLDLNGYYLVNDYAQVKANFGEI